MDFDSFKDALGSGAVIVMDKSTDIVTAIARFAHVSSYNVPFKFSQLLLPPLTVL